MFFRCHILYITTLSVRHVVKSHSVSKPILCIVTLCIWGLKCVKYKDQSDIKVLLSLCRKGDTAALAYDSNLL